MKNNLYRLFKEKNLDTNFILEAFENLMSLEDGLDNYVTNFKFDNTLESCANYSCLDKNIRFNYDKLENENFNESYKKLNALLVLRHEIEHAKALKKVMERKNDIESLVLRYSFLDYFLEKNIDMNINIEGINHKDIENRIRDSYDVDPGERVASIRSAKYLINVFKNTDSKELLLDLRKALYLDYIQCYDEGSPTYQYLNNLGLNTELEKIQSIVRNKGYSLDTRALCGLPLTVPELAFDLRYKCGIKKHYHR